VTDRTSEQRILYLKSVSCINNSRFPDSRALAKILKSYIRKFLRKQIIIIADYPEVVLSDFKKVINLQ
jgi:hypothetical protein